MRRHVVWPLICMPVECIAIGHQAREECVEIVANIRIGIFLNDQGCRCVADEDIADANVDACGCNDVLYLAGDVIQASSGRMDVQDLLMHAEDLSHP